MESYCSLCTLDTIHRLFFVTRLIINKINKVQWVDFKLENVLVSLHSLKTMGLGSIIFKEWRVTWTFSYTYYWSLLLLGNFLKMLMVPRSNWLWTVTTDPVWHFPHQIVIKYIKVSCYSFNMNIMQYFGKYSPCTRCTCTEGIEI